MIGQSLAIIAVIMVMVFMFLRSGRREITFFVLPLISVSLFHLLGAAVYRWLAESEFSTMTLYCAIDIAGLIAGILSCAFLSRAIVNKRIRIVYLVCCVVFLTALTVAYVLYLT